MWILIYTSRNEFVFFSITFLKFTFIYYQCSGSLFNTHTHTSNSCFVLLYWPVILYQTECHRMTDDSLISVQCPKALPFQFPTPSKRSIIRNWTHLEVVNCSQPAVIRRDKLLKTVIHNVGLSSQWSIVIPKSSFTIIYKAHKPSSSLSGQSSEEVINSK